MSEIKRYDQALSNQLEHVNMPPEDMAWAEMKKLLEEDDDEPVIIPFFRRPGCLFPAFILALLLAVGGWFYFKQPANTIPVREQSLSDSSGTPPRTQQNARDMPALDSAGSSNLRSTDGSQKLKTTGNPDKGFLTTTGRNGNAAGTSSLGNREDTQHPDSRSGSRQKTTVSPGRASIAVTAPGLDNTGVDGRRTKRRGGYVSGKSTATKARIVAATTQADNDPSIDEHDPGNIKTKLAETGNATMMISPGTMDSTQVETSGVDSPNIVKKDPAPLKTNKLPVETPKESASIEEEKDKKENSWMLAAGLSIYHPLPLQGEPTVPYNYYGRKGSLTDYIPAVHFRLYRTKLGFIHTGFRYGAPQSVKPFNYKREVLDSQQAVFRTIYQLRKTYYHQVPLNFSYFVLPHLSVGAGLIYNHFSGAIAQKEVFRSSGGAVDTLVSSGIVKDQEAGKFVKNHFQWSAAIEYQWRRLSIGGRYSADINPYIEYTDITTGLPAEKKTRAMNIFLRYELWRSKKW